MHQTFRLLTALALCATVLAGCSGKAATASDSLDQAAQDLKVQATATTGVIRGIVVDTAVRPVGGVHVTTQSGGKTLSANTTAAGAFGFEGLPAGTYFLKTHKPGYADTQTSADVVAGVSDPSVTKVQIIQDVSTQPSFDLFHFKGFLECSILTGPFFTPCYTPALGPVPETHVGNDNSFTRLNFTGNVTYIETDMVWQPTQAFGQEMYFNSCYTEAGYPNGCIMYTGGPSPQVANATGKNAALYEKTGKIYFEVASNGVGNALPDNPTGFQDPGGASIEQDFDAYFVVCHYFQPPAGYSFATAGAPVPPA